MGKRIIKKGLNERMKYEYERLLQIKITLNKLEPQISYGLREFYGLHQALWNIRELIEEHIKAQTEKGIEVAPSYVDAQSEELELEYSIMQQAIDNET